MVERRPGIDHTTLAKWRTGVRKLAGLYAQGLRELNAHFLATLDEAGINSELVRDPEFQRVLSQELSRADAEKLAADIPRRVGQLRPSTPPPSERPRSSVAADDSLLGTVDRRVAVMPPMTTIAPIRPPAGPGIAQQEDRLAASQRLEAEVAGHTRMDEAKRARLVARRSDIQSSLTRLRGYSAPDRTRRLTADEELARRRRDEEMRALEDELEGIEEQLGRGR